MTKNTDQPTSQPAQWYSNGLRFECTRCGNCCKGEGTVRVDDNEQKQIAQALEIPLEDFQERYLRRLPDGEMSLVDKPNKDCVFWEEDKGCGIYALRPRQCRTWPFWRGNIATPKHWSWSSENCPGMDRGKRYSAAEIEAQAESDGTSGIVPDLHEWT